MHFLKVAAPDIEVIHIPNGGYRRKIEAALLKGMGVKAGVADLLLLWKPGRCGFIELKSDRRRCRISAEQQAFGIRMWERAIPYAVCTSIDGVSSVLKSWDAPLRVR